ncbi:gamma-glutamyltransferase [Xanthobacter sp. DSM 24535]|uniref:gamma-glutamyltransferase n=1 Tax=Roseixanthobacter psychrophilus TaxID=3119917 RepID=UPI0037281D06
MSLPAIARRIALLLLLAGLPLKAHAISPYPVEGQSGMVVSEQALAARVGADILRQGGNAVDAAVAMGYALAVVHPCCGNLGGGGYMLVRLADGTATFIDFRETAPGGASAGMYLDGAGNVIPEASLRGWQAVAVPGTVMGLDAALARFGTLSRTQVMAPAIALAAEGYLLSAGDAAILATGTADFRADPQLAAIFLKDGAPLRAGDRLVQGDLSATLSAIAAHGPSAFYRGDIPKRIAAASAAGGGLLSARDLADYAVRVEAPLRCTYRGYDILTAAPSSAGGTAICEILNILEGYDLSASGFGAAETVHVMAEAMRHAFIDRNSVLIDPAFGANPLSRLLSKDYAVSIRARIDPAKAGVSTPGDVGAAPHEGTETTHYSVADAAGNTVAVTTSLNAYFGARVMAPGTGVFLNDTMDDFTAKPDTANAFGLVQGARNAIAPGKRPLSSMSPTIVVHDGKPFLVLGSPGGSRIISSVMQAIVNVIDHRMTLQEAVDAPRIHHQWLPDVLFAEPYALSPDTIRVLVAMGYKVVVQRPWGAVEAIQFHEAGAAGPQQPAFGADTLRLWKPKPGTVFGANDNRRPAGAAVAP